MNKNKKWLWLALPAAIASGLAVGHFWHDAPSSTLSTSAVQALAADGMTPINPKPAPNFHLINQNGQPVSLSQFRGKAVVLTFLDPVCYWDCPLEAQELIDMDQVLGPKLASHVEILAVVANPQFHSLSDTDAFDAEHGLSHISNWTYATAKSVSTLKSVWHAYYEYVNAPKFGMIQHTDVFWLITPQGKEGWLSDPSAQTKYVGGTAQLLATYVAKMLKKPLPPTPSKLGGLHAGIWHAMGLSYDLFPALPDMPALAEYPYQGYRGIAARDTGKNTWTSGTPVAMSQRGGIELDPLSSGTIWAMIGPYGLQIDSMIRTTSNGGSSWSAPLPLPGALPPHAVKPLAAVSDTKAWALAGHNLVQTTNGGEQWTIISKHVPWLKGAVLTPGPSATLWLSGQTHAGRSASVDEYSASGWRIASLPLPPSWHNGPITVSAPAFSGTSQGGIGIVQDTHGHEKMVWDTTANGGKTWQAGSAPVSITGNPQATVQSNGHVVYAVQARTHGSRLMAWSLGEKLWRPVGPMLNSPTAVEALSVSPSGAFALMTKGSPLPAVWRLASAQSAWIKSGTL